MRDILEMKRGLLEHDSVYSLLSLGIRYLGSPS